MIATSQNFEIPKARVEASHIFFHVQGEGTFRTGMSHVLTNAKEAWARQSEPVLLSAQPAPGHRFSHWLFNGEFGGNKMTQAAKVEDGLVITAVFRRSLG